MAKLLVLMGTLEFDNDAIKPWSAVSPDQQPPPGMGVAVLTRYPFL